MRPGQHNKRRNRHRGGGGGSSGGNGGNPLSRVYESNGPDVKVRGTAQTVADKYLQLGRDAQSAGDIIMAESYYQHAEHYLRIVAAAQAYNQQMQPQYQRQGDDGDDGEAGEDGAEGASAEQRNQPQPQGDIGESEQPREFDGNRNQRQQRDFRDRDRNRPRWQDRRNDERSNGDARQPRNIDQGAEAAQPGSEPGDGKWEAPSFLRRPAPTPPGEGGQEGAQAQDESAARKPRGRRPRGEDAQDQTAEQPEPAGD